MNIIRNEILMDLQLLKHQHKHSKIIVRLHTSHIDVKLNKYRALNVLDVTYKHISVKGDALMNCIHYLEFFSVKFINLRFLISSEIH